MSSTAVLPGAMLGSDPAAAARSAARNRPAAPTPGRRAREIEYRGVHGTKLTRVSGDSTGKGILLGAVVVPTVKSFGDPLPGLLLAAETALEFRRPLVVIASREARVEEFPARLRRRLGSSLHLIQISRISDGWLPKLPSMGHWFTPWSTDESVGAKRDLALVLALASGWPTVLFVDDDIKRFRQRETLSPARVRDSLRMMRRQPELKAVGWPSVDFPDNSMIGHARRRAGQSQGVFIGGNALLVRCEPGMPFFCAQYNEDWFFLLGLLLRHGGSWAALACAGVNRQVPYQPFTRGRAIGQEVGDLIAEVLMNVAEDKPGSGWPQFDAEFWAQASRNRCTLIEDLLKSLCHDGVTEEVVEALQLAGRCQAELPAELPVRFLSQRQADQQEWDRHTEIAARSGMADAARAAASGGPPRWHRPGPAG